LPDGRTVSLEAHVDKYQPDAFPVGADILLSWQPGEATVIPA
ncbi:ABC transporter ATP-binding protein, partial [Ensifer sp. 2YAB10]